MSTTEVLANKLRLSIENGDFKNVEDLLVDVNDTKTFKEIEAKFLNDAGRDPVNLAIDYREENIATYLVEKGFSTDYLYQTGDTLFHLYIDKPKVYMYLFANAGIPVNIQNNNGDTGLHIAVRKNLPETVQALIQCGADLTSRNLMGQTPLDEAEGGIKSLLEYFQDNIGETLLSHAVEANNLDIVKLLLAHEAKINQIRVREEETSDVTVPLFHKALQPHIDQEIAKHLHTKMNISEHSEKDCDGNTAILRAIEEGCSPKLINWLIKVTEGRALVDRNAVGLSPRELAVAVHNDAIVKVIDNYITQNHQCLPLFASHYHREKDLLNIKDEASGKNLIDLVQEQDSSILKKWPNFQEEENKGVHLFEAVAHGNSNKDIEKLYGHFKDRNGYTALIRAVVYQQEECNRYPLHYAYALPEEYSNRFVRILLEKNPEDIERRVDKDGRLPADYMKIRNTVEIQKILYDARTLDVYGKRGPPLGAWPDGAKRVPPDADQIPL
ncbi:hypothetical protein KUTeg_023249 [Tegillarca granosa]|uniref:Uncharacterized protein n=1 Tax=Tegillarca granosa TaxID=220873 RepID=A0ABQ9E4M7_TEGGR|nr:hypothetical protein KUTeg_023249 [Tegillarca granosa]